MKKVICLLLLLLLAAKHSNAIKVLGGRSVVINHPVHEDLYILAGNVVVNAPVFGDLIAMGGTIQINDSVTNDILVAGGNVTLNGYVGDDIRCASGELLILKKVEGDLVIMGGSVTVDKKSSVTNLIMIGGRIVVDGIITNNVDCKTGRFTLNGLAMQDLRVRAEDININGDVLGDAFLSASGNIRIGDSAMFMKSIHYWCPEKVSFRNAIRGDQPVYDSSLRSRYGRWYYLGFSALLGSVWYISAAFVMIMLLQYLFGNTMKKAGITFYDAALRSLGFGALFCIALPITIAILFISLVGIPIALILLFSAIILLLTSSVIISVVLANWINEFTAKRFGFWRLSLSALGVFILLKLLFFTPFVGCLLMTILAFMSFGSILINIKWRKQGNTSAT